MLLEKRFFKNVFRLNIVLLGYFLLGRVAVAIPDRLNGSLTPNMALPTAGYLQSPSEITDLFDK